MAAQTPEGKVKTRVRKILRKYGVYYFMPVQTGYGNTTLDFLCCVRGKFFAIETKAPGGGLTPKQSLVADEIIAAWGSVFVLDGKEVGYANLENWLQTNA